MDPDKCLEAWTLWEPDTCHPPEEPRCAKLWSETSLPAWRLLQCRQKSLINYHYKMWAQLTRLLSGLVFLSCSETLCLYCCTTWNYCVGISTDVPEIALILSRNLFPQANFDLSFPLSFVLNKNRLFRLKGTVPWLVPCLCYPGNLILQLLGMTQWSGYLFRSNKFLVSCSWFDAVR